ncbi:carbohydrate binding family 9 domain-containing protein [Pontibacter sp. KCTC 32443]|uniref:DUF5916 domain-containing protein n=1 Tax=Pontibacter TaxID=323449 RepID=UPI00164E0D42|nr:MULTISPECIES: DUF5916 domain-containing protein [Pontibacter]MBC5775508.1 carbohydrate binding family 9 domain-containing protein [Pontibacter sp. KCTC 32443]
MLYKYLTLAITFTLLTGTASATNTDKNKEPEAADLKMKTTMAMRATQAPVLDGYLEPEVWQQVRPATNFVRYDPLNGKPSSQETEVYLLYDNEAVYIGAKLHDTAPDSILTQLGGRDSGENNADMFAVYLDTYNDKQNAFSFMVSAAGVQTDIKFSQGREDWNWDAVWASSTKLTDEGWVVEMKIPYGAIRFPETEVQTWGVNFMRVIRRTREKSYWNHVNNLVEGFVSQEGRAIGIEGIKSPVRLQFTPYVSGYLNHYSGDTKGKSNYSRSLNGGMDVKYGINDAFTLDVTLVPDFGQAQSDNQVLNLSPFEVKFGENRQFFTEGTELFNKAGLFYSRRIGGTPMFRGSVGDSLQENEVILENPGISGLLNAAKVSGRTIKGLGIGLFNAFTRNMYATVQNTETGETREILTDPFTNYSVFVLDQTLPRNSFVTFTNTNVSRTKGVYDANVSGLQLRFADKTNNFAIRAGGNLSQLYGSNIILRGDTLPDKLHLGHQYNVNLSKISGNLRYGINHHVESDTYEINDLGYLSNNNEISNSASISYNFFQPIWKFLSWGSSMSVSQSMQYAPREFVSTSMGVSTNVRFRNFMSSYWSFGMRPGNAYDYYEARSREILRVFIKPPAFDTNIGISSDYRKRLAFDASTGFWRSNRYDQFSWWGNLSPRFRVNDKFSLVQSNNYRQEKRNIGYAGKDENSHIIFADRTIKTFTSTLSGAYIFNEKAGITLNMRHYWSSAAILDLYELTETGFLQSPTAERNGNLNGRFNNINYNVFNVDLVYSWRFAPGSELMVVWKNEIKDQRKEIQNKYIENVSKTLQSPQNNNFSVKLLYYIDYIAIKNVLSA